MNKDTTYYVDDDEDMSEDFNDYKEALAYAKKRVSSTLSPSIWKRERVVILEQNVTITKAK